MPFDARQNVAHHLDGGQIAPPKERGHVGAIEIGNGAHSSSSQQHSTPRTFP
jgi:hypothetical protein